MYVSYALAGILESAPGKGRLPAGTWTSTAWVFMVKAKITKVINVIKIVFII